MTRVFRPLVVTLLLMVAAARPCLAAPADRFVAWLAAHPEVNMVAVSSHDGRPGPYGLRFPQRPTKPWPPRALIRIGDPDGSLICIVLVDRNLCVRGPAAAHLWTAQDLSRETAHLFAPVVVVGPLPGDRLMTFALRLPEGTARVGKTVAFNPRRRDEITGPWWSHNLEAPVRGNLRSALKDATSIATVKGPDWLADAGGFAVLTTDTPGVLRLIVNDDESICVRAKAWTCHRLALATMDELHPGLPPTDRRLSKQPPSIYRVQATRGERPTLALEYDWIRSKVARTPGLEFTGTALEMLELVPGRGFVRRGLMEMMFGRMTHLAYVPTGFLVGGAPSARCIDLVEAGGPLPRKMAVAPPGRYCLDGRGSLAREAGPNAP